MITKLEEASKTDDYAQMKELNETIKNRMMDVGQQIYNQTPDQASTSSQGPGDDVIETDFSTEK